MPTVTCICEKCGLSYYTKDEMYHPLTQNQFRMAKRQKEIPSTWEDWILHVSTHCETCRLPYTPSSCLKDLQNLKGG